MKRFLIFSLLALALPAAALAKGASEATIEGPGLNGVVTIPGDGEDGGMTSLGRIAELAGFFPAVFGQVPTGVVPGKPNVRLGPRYVVRYTMPGPGTTSIIEQDVYPYATPYPVTFTPPGQPFWDGQHTVGGWYATTTELKLTLEDVGLQETAPPVGDGDGFWSNTPRIVGMAGGIAAVLLAAVGAVVLLRRRRLHPAATS
jgi:hypothetical protein